MTPDSLRDWYVTTALPLWSRHGIDPAQGAFFELLAHDGTPIERARRARLTARQIYCFAIGPGLGWSGPAQEIVRNGLVFLRRHLLRPDGTVRRSVTREGVPVDDGCDLYDDAFVLFALATVQDRPGADPDLAQLARQIGAATLARAGHSDGSLRDDPDRILANPLMHLFEAALAWVEIDPDPEGPWHQLADRLARFAQDRLILRPPQLPATALPEAFDAQGRLCDAAQGGIIEPGHQFEWGWLLARWSRHVSSAAAFADALALGQLAEAHGIDPRRGVAISELDTALAPRDTTARLWPQTERAKFWHAVLHHPATTPDLRAQALDCREKALAGLAKFLDDTTPGLWREVMTEAGTFVTEPVRASSLYHIACAALTLADPDTPPKENRPCLTPRLPGLPPWSRILPRAGCFAWAT